MMRQSLAFSSFLVSQYNVVGLWGDGLIIFVDKWRIEWAESYFHIQNISKMQTKTL
jgi:hypothetical protein